MRDETSIEVTKVRSKQDSAAAVHHKLSVSIRLIVEAPKTRKNGASDSLAKLRKVYEEGRKV